MDNLIHALTRKRPLTTPNEDSTTLKRSLAIPHVIGIGIGFCLGAGVFITSGKIAHDDSGPSVVISFIIAGFAALLSGLCYAEFSVRFPVTGSAYSYAYVSLGEVLAWIVGWNLTLEYGLCAAAIAAGWSQYLQALFVSVGVDSFPDWLVQWPVPGSSGILVLNPLAFLLILFCTAVSMRTIKEFGRLTVYVTVFNVGVIVFFIIAGSFFIDTSNYKKFMPYGFSGTISGAATSFFSYIGFDCVSNFSAEMRNPRRAIPLGLFSSLCAVTALYCGVGVVITGMQHYSLIDVTAPLSKAFDYHDQEWASALVSVGSLTCTTFCALGGVMGQPRILYAMARDGLLFEKFGQVDERQVPAFGTLVTGFSAGLLALLVDFTVLADLVSAGTLVAFCVVCAGTVVNKFEEGGADGGICERPFLWRKRAHLSVGWFFVGSFMFWLMYTYGVGYVEVTSVLLLGVPLVLILVCFYFTPRDRTDLPFNIPLMPFVPLAGININAYLFSGLGWKSLAALGGWTVLGQCIYLGYGVWHSKLRYTSSVLNPSPFATETLVFEVPDVVKK